MQKKTLWLAAHIALLAVSCAAQTNTFPATGNVGIGMTNPQAPLNVGGQVMIGAPYRGDASLQISQSYGCCGRLTQINPTGNSLGAKNIMASTDSTGNGQWWTWGVYQNQWTINPGLEFGTGFTINSSGHVGIGTNSPGSPLEVYGSVKLSSGSGGGIIFPDGTTQTTAAISNIYQSGGNVGIGTTAPSQVLSVNGSVATGGPGTGVYLRDATTDVNRNTNVTPLLLHEGLTSGNGSTLGWGLHIGAIPWTWGQDPIYYHAGTHSFLTRQGNGSEALAMILSADGNLGIGTGGPGAKLEVNGNIKLSSGSGASVIFPDGTVQSTAWNGTLGGGDYAESVDVSGDHAQYEPGDVLVINPDAPGNFLKSTEAYSTAVAGIYSTKPGLRGRRQTTDRALMKNEVPMAMIGIVPTKVTAESGPIKPGDLLVTSTRPGYAMKGADRTLLSGAIVGKAMGNLASGTGVIEVLVSLQ